MKGEPSGSKGTSNQDESEAAEEDEPIDEEQLKSMADKLPEGFFDDPKVDAKVNKPQNLENPQTFHFELSHFVLARSER